MYQPHKILVIASRFPAHQEDKQAQWLKAFYDRLSSHGHDITVLAPTQGTSHSENRNGIQIEWFSCYFASTFVALNQAASNPKSRQSFNIFLLPYIVMGCIAAFRFARDSSFDVIHVHSAFPDGPIGLFARSVNGASLIYLAHEDEVPVSSAWSINKYFHFFIRSVDMLVSNSAELADTMKSHVNRCWNVLEYEAEPKKALNDSELTGVLRVLVLVDPNESSVSALLHAISNVQQQHRVSFSICGLRGYRKNLPYWYGGFKMDTSVEILEDFDGLCYDDAFASSDVCVVVGSTTSTDQEGVFRNFIFEAYRNGKPVAATDIANIREVVIDNVTGFLVPPDDSIALSDAINNLLAHPFKRECFGESGFKLRQETSAWDRIMSELEDLQCIASGLPFRLQPIAYSPKKFNYT